MKTYHSVKKSTRWQNISLGPRRNLNEVVQEFFENFSDSVREKRKIDLERSDQAFKNILSRIMPYEREDLQQRYENLKNVYNRKEFYSLN